MEELVQDLRRHLLPFKDGNCSVHVEYESHNAVARLEFPEDWNISLDEKLLRQLAQVSGVLSTDVVYKKQGINA